MLMSVIRWEECSRQMSRYPGALVFQDRDQVKVPKDSWEAWEKLAAVFSPAVTVPTQDQNKYPKAILMYLVSVLGNSLFLLLGAKQMRISFSTAPQILGHRQPPTPREPMTAQHLRHLGVTA